MSAPSARTPVTRPSGDLQPGELHPGEQFRPGLVHLGPEVSQHAVAAGDSAVREGQHRLIEGLAADDVLLFQHQHGGAALAHRLGGRRHARTPGPGDHQPGIELPLGAHPPVPGQAG